MTNIPIGVQDFRKIRDLGLYFVDKSLLIDKILSKRGTEAFLFTRPRRFGKSVNLSMLDAYLNLRYSDNRWFDDLEISRVRVDDPEKNSYPVIYLDLKNISSAWYDVMVDKMRMEIASICKEFPELATSERQNEADIHLFNELVDRKSDMGVLLNSIRLISSMLAKEYDRKVVILIDEYDNPVNQSYGTGFQKDALNLVRELLNPALKNNNDLAFAVVTGVMQIAKESIFSGLNNVSVNNILSRDSDEMFGFTADEVRKLCEDLGHPEKFDEARDWYDGYRFGDADIYNPWSVLSYADQSFTPAQYWAGTSSNSIIDDLLSIPDQTTYDDLMVLGSGGRVEHDVHPGITFADISERSDGIYSIMAMTGYLTAQSEDGSTFLKIPNREMYTVFADHIVNRMGSPGMHPKLRRLSRALTDNDTDAVSATLEDILMSVMSSRILDDEHPYQAFLTGLSMNLFGRYEITADMEGGKGFHDIRMRRLRGPGPNIVVEVKRVRDKEDPEALAAEALWQIHDRRYYHGMTGRTILYGIAFQGKTPTTLSETLELTD